LLAALETLPQTEFAMVPGDILRAGFTILLFIYYLSIYLYDNYSVVVGTCGIFNHRCRIRSYVHRQQNALRICVV